MAREAILKYLRASVVPFLASDVVMVVLDCDRRGSAARDYSSREIGDNSAWFHTWYGACRYSMDGVEGPSEYSRHSDNRW